MVQKPETMETGERMLLALPGPETIAAKTGPAATANPPRPLSRWNAGSIAGGRRPSFADGQGRIRVLGALVGAIEAELDRGAAFLAVPVCLGIGALLYFSFNSEPGGLPILLGGGVLLIARRLSAGRPWFGMLLSAALLTLLGIGFAKLETLRHPTRMLGSEISTRLTGKVVAIEHLANRRIRLTLDVVATERPTLRYVPQRVRATTRTVPEDVRIGSRITGTARLVPISGPLRPGSYDFSFKSYFDGIGATGFFLQEPKLAASPDPPAPAERAGAFVENARLAIADRIRNRIGGSEGEIAAALVVGVRAGIPDETNEALRKSGLYHVISISGLHMALVAGTIMAAMRFGFALFGNFSSRHAVKKLAALAALGATAGYLFFSGAEVAAQRSFLMLGVMLTAVLFDRPAITMRNLAIAATAVIVVSPHEVTGPSFQMSFAAAAALIGAFEWWSQNRASGTGGVPRQRSLLFGAVRAVAIGLAGLAATSLIAGMATAIFGAYHFQRVSPLGLGANLVAMPVVSVLVMPFAVLAAVAMPIGLDGPFLDVMGKGLTIMIAVADWFSARSPVDAVGTVAPVSVMLLSAALLIATFAGTWLRAGAVPAALLGLALLPFGEAPDVLVSEDARLVGVAVQDGSIAINRARPSAFVLEDWQRAFKTDTRITPVKGKPTLDLDESAAFRCQEGLCLIRHRSGAIIAHATSAMAAKQACGIASLLVVDDATVEKPCPQATTVAIGKRMLARRGSASVILPAAGSSAAPVIGYAVEAPYRPWHEHRRFSRAARGLPAYVRQNLNSAAPAGKAENNDAPERRVQ